MNITLPVFYLISAVILTFGFLSVTTRKIFRAAIFLLFSLIGIASLYFLLEYEFLAAVQIVVYVGGIVVLIIFSIFLTNKSGEEMKLPANGRELAAFLSATLGFAFVYLVLLRAPLHPSPMPAVNSGVQAIGLQLLDTHEQGFILPFEVVSILLLACMVGAIVIAMRVKPKEK